MDQTQKKIEPIAWITYKHDSPFAYLQEAKKMARSAKVGLVIRRSGKSSLGLLGVKHDTEDTLLRKRWAAKGVPSDWLPGTFRTMLEKNKRRVIEDVQPPKFRYGLWTFKAAPPDYSLPGCIIQLNEKNSIMISPWVAPKKQRPQTMPLPRVRKGWLTTSQSAEQKDSTLNKNQEDAVAVTVPDGSDTEDATMGDPKAGTKRAQVESPDKKGATAHVSKKKQLKVRPTKSAVQTKPLNGTSEVPVIAGFV